MNLIAAVDRNWAIGKAGRELVNIPEDKKFFREETTGKVIVMGRKTFESLPGAMALAGRTNITKVDYKYDADTYFPNLDKLSEWEIKETSEEKTYFDMIYEFVRYSRKK